MKISFVEPHLEIYGGIRRIIELANRLTDRGHDVTVFHSDGSPCKWMKCKCRIKSYHDVLDEAHDVLIYNDPNPIDYGLVKDARARLKVFYVLELYERSLLKGTNPKIYLPRNRRMLLLKKSIRSPYLKLSNSTWIYRWLKEHMNIDSKLVIGGVNSEMFHPVEVQRNPDEIRILCAGDPRERKGTKTVFEAVEMTKKEEPKIVLDTYYGKGIPQEKMAEKYSSADIFVDARWYAGWNNPVAEAMACKVPVVCTDIGGVKDFAFHEKSVLLVPPKAPKAMALAILRLIDDEGLREKLRKNAYEHISQFHWDKSAKRMEEILESELERRKTPLTIKVKSKLKEGIDKLKIVAGGSYHFDKYAKWGSYHWDIYYNNKDQIYRQHVDYIVNSFKGEGTLLDIGCGDGLITSLLSERGFEVKGIDIEKTAIRLAREKCPHLDFGVQDIFAMDKEFDYVLASEVIEHLSNPDEFLEKIKGLFKKQALITTPKRDYHKDPSPYHHKECSFHEFSQLIKHHYGKFRIDSSEHHLYAWIQK